MKTGVTTALAALAVVADGGQLGWGFRQPPAHVGQGAGAAPPAPAVNAEKPK